MNPRILDGEGGGLSAREMHLIPLNYLIYWLISIWNFFLVPPIIWVQQFLGLRRCVEIFNVFVSNFNTFSIPVQ